MKSLTVYDVYIDDGMNCSKVIIPAENESKAKEYVKGNGEVVAIRKDQSLANYQAGCKDIRTRIEKMLSCEIKRAKHNARLKEYGPVWQDAWLARAGSYEYILERIRQSVL